LHQNEDLQKQLLQQQKLQQQQQQQQHPPKVDPKQKQSKSPIKGASPVPVVVAAAAAAPQIDSQQLLLQQQQIEEMTQQLGKYEAEIQDLKEQLQVNTFPPPASLPRAHQSLVFFRLSRDGRADLCSGG
jgi:cell division protein FtsX